MTTLYGLSLTNYRGIGREQRAGPFGRCNFFIGANNSGKSAVLNFLSLYGAQINNLGVSPGRHSRLTIQPLEIHLGQTIRDVAFGIALSSEQLAQRLVNKMHAGSKYDRNTVEVVVRKFVNAMAVDGLIWLSATAERLDAASLDNNLLQGVFMQLDPFLDRRILESAILGVSSLPQEWFPLVHKWVAEAFFEMMGEPKLIPAIRQIGKKGGNFSDYSGEGLIDELATLQNPGVMERDRRKLFDQINDLVRSVIGVPSAQIEIPHDRNEILVHVENRVLPLSFLGTGIHETVMIASFCTLTHDSIVCIEEPEIHLHPLLQRKLIDYLISHTNNQYFIATHSASIIDYPDAAIFHITQNEGETKISPVITDVERVGVCRDLGYKASDLLQTNFIIWVEGPSDRVYVLHWLRSKARDLTEGIHFSIMFYGGRLLSHLSADEEIVNDFISLRRLNQHMAILIDSDMRDSEQKLNSTKLRIIKEFEENNNFVWVTDGREIESYFPPEVVSAVLKSRYKDFNELAKPGRYGDPLAYKRVSEPEKTAEPDKIVVSRLLCQTDNNFDFLDLGIRVDNLVNAIRLANH